MAVGVVGGGGGAMTICDMLKFIGEVAVVVIAFTAELFTGVAITDISSSGRHDLSLLGWCGNWFAAAHEAFSTAFEVRWLLHSLEKHRSTKDGNKNNVQQKGDREIPRVSQFFDKLLERRLDVI
jgi:hypothetical protein